MSFDRNFWETTMTTLPYVSADTADSIFRDLIGVYLHIYYLLEGFWSLGKTSGPTTKATGSKALLKVVFCKVRSRCISQEGWNG